MKMEIYIPTETHECRCCFSHNAYCITNEKLGYYTYLCESCLDELKSLKKPKKLLLKHKYSIFINGVQAITEKHFTGKEIRLKLGGQGLVWDKIPESEIVIEVEE